MKIWSKSKILDMLGTAECPSRKTVKIFSAVAKTRAIANKVVEVVASNAENRDAWVSVYHGLVLLLQQDTTIWWADFIAECKKRNISYTVVTDWDLVMTLPDMDAAPLIEPLDIRSHERQPLLSNMLKNIRV